MFENCPIWMPVVVGTIVGSVLGYDILVLYAFGKTIVEWVQGLIEKHKAKKAEQ